MRPGRSAKQDRREAALDRLLERAAPEPNERQQKEIATLKKHLGVG